MHNPVELLLSKNSDQYKKIVPFNPQKDKLLAMDLSGNNTRLTAPIFNDTNLFSGFITNELESNNASYGIGGYLENREVYSRSPIFSGDSPDISISFIQRRSIHLGLDIWGPAGTPVFAPWGGSVHSFAFNKQFGDYGATIILQHQDTEKHGFQYLDWQFEGNDLVVLSRTAFDDAEGGAHRQHDANFITYHMIKNFRKPGIKVE